jgi:hypothetical protein
MDNPDFRNWLDYHRGAYPGLSAWLKTNPDQLDHWERILSRLELWQARAATDAMAASDEQPKGYGEHARAIRRIAMAAAGIHQEGYEQRTEGPTIIDDHLVAQCPRCMDYGIVSVLSPECLRRLWADDERQSLSTCIVACDCERGRVKSRNMKLPQWQEGHALFRYEDILDAAIDNSDEHSSISDGEWQIAKEMLGKFHAGRHVHPDFAEYA